MTEQQSAFKLEIENAMKKWTDQAEMLNMHLVISVSIKPKDNNEGFNHMKSIFANKTIAVNHCLAVADEMPKDLKTQMIIRMLSVLTGDDSMDVDESGDNRKEILPRINPLQN
jgi:hypothetical protein